LRNGYYDTFEAAKLLGVDSATIRSWVHRGKLPTGRYLAGRLRWTKSQLVAARDGNTTPAAATSRVTEARCGCGAAARAEPADNGFILVRCLQCGASMAIESDHSYVRRLDIDIAEMQIDPSTSDNDALLASRVAIHRAKQAKGTPLVYFIRLGAYMKIGTSVDVRSRIGSLSLADGNLLAVIPGSYDVEREMHQRFARLRSFKEWFYFQDELKAYVAELQQQLVNEFTSSDGEAA